MSTIGSDPEYLLFSDALKTHVPSIGLLGGSKESPMIVLGGAVQEDNVTAEINIDPVDINDTDGFLANINRVRAHVDSLVQGVGLRTVVEASAEYQEDMLMHPQAMASGCDPDRNAYTGTENEYPDIAETRFRCAGGHIHFGNTDLFAEPGSRETFIKYCDYFVGAPLSIIDTDTVRKRTYGKAGNFRYKPYGVEYRTPSNIWLKSEGLMRFVLQQMRRAEQAFIEHDGHPLAVAEQILRYTIQADDKDSTRRHLPKDVVKQVKEASCS